MSLPAGASEALALFSATAGWEQRARSLMQWGERLAPLDVAERSEANRVQGCESVVWLVAEQRDGQWRFRAASEARLLRGLLALLLVRVEGLTSSEVRGLDLPDWFGQLGLGRQLSPSRANGMNAVLQRIDALMRAS